MEGHVTQLLSTKMVLLLAFAFMAMLVHGKLPLRTTTTRMGPPSTTPRMGPPSTTPRMGPPSTTPGMGPPFYNSDLYYLQRIIDQLRRDLNEQKSQIQTLQIQIEILKQKIAELEQSNERTTSPAPTTPALVPESYTDTTSTEFVVMFQETPPYTTNKLQLMVVAGRRGPLKLEDKLNGTFSKTGLTRGVNILNITSSHLGKETEINKKGLLLKTKFPVAVYGMYQSKFSAEGFNAIPTSGLGTKYVVMNYFNESLRYFPKGYKIMVTAVKDSTDVAIRFNLTFFDSVQIFGKSYKDGDTYTTTLDKLQTLHIDHKVDLTGTVVTSNRPIAVTSGGRCDWVIQTPVNCQPNFEFLPPTISWGQRFLIPDISHTPHYVLKILAKSWKTEFHIVTKNSVSFHTLSANQFFEIVTPNEAALIISNKPIYIALFTETTRQMGSIMVTVPADKQYANNYYLGFLNQDLASSFVNIAIQTDQLKGLRVGRRRLNLRSANRTDLALGARRFTSVTIPVTQSFQRISHIDSTVRFGVIIYGFYHYDGFKVRAFGYPGGLRVPENEFVN